MASYSIKDLENFTGIKAHTIRIWEKRYGVVEPQRTPTNIRYYTDEDLKRLLNISILNRNGFKISKILQLDKDTINDEILSLTETEDNVVSQIESLVVSMIDLDEKRFLNTFNAAIVNMGFEDTIVKVIYPFFERIGYLWQIGTIHPAQEHFISNLIRNKLIAAIDAIAEIPGKDKKTFILYLPEGEWHEMGLLFYEYILKKHGYQVIYLGQSVPFESIGHVIKLKGADTLLTAFISSVSKRELQSYLNKLGKSFPQITIFLTGVFFLSQNLKLSANMIRIENIQFFKENYL